MSAETFAFGFTASQKILQANLREISHAESLLSGHDASNCINWLAGHILVSRNRLAVLLGAGGPYLSDEDLARYGRGSARLTGEDISVDLQTIQQGLEISCADLVAKIGSLQAADLDAPLDPAIFPIKPATPNVAARIEFALMHECYHSGQIGTVRKLIGKASGLGV